MKKRVYHLPLDGCTDVFEALLEENDLLLDFQTQNHTQDDDSFDSSTLPFWMSKSSGSKDDQSENDCSTSSLLPFWMTKSYSSGSDSGQSSSCTKMGKSSSSGSDSTQSSLCFTMSLSSCSDQSEDYHSDPSSLPFWMSHSSSIEDEDTNHLMEGKRPENQPSFRFQTSSDGKKLILEVTENTMEPFYELSFRHIINDDMGTVGSVGDGDILVGEKILLGEGKSDVKVGQVRKKSSLSRDQIITNNQRINTAVFLLKMFVPASLRSKAKSRNATNSSKISHKTSFDGIIENTLKTQIYEKLETNKSKGMDGVAIATSQKRLVGGKFLSCFCKMSDSQRYIGNALMRDGYNK